MLVKLLTSLFKLSCHNILGHKIIEYPKTQNIEYHRTKKQNIPVYTRTQNIEYHRTNKQNIPVYTRTQDIEYHRTKKQNIPVYTRIQKQNIIGFKNVEYPRKKQNIPGLNNRISQDTKSWNIPGQNEADYTRKEKNII